MFLTPSLQSTRGTKIGLKSLVTISCFLGVELSLRMVHSTTLIPFGRFVIDRYPSDLILQESLTDFPL
jgi:hypothetical protein